MKRYTLGISALIAMATGVLAEEHTVSAAPFEKTVSVGGTLLPEDTTPYRLEPKAWETFSILEVVPQGARVRAGEPLVVIKTEDLDRQIEDGKKAQVARALARAGAERELEDLKIQTPRALAAAERAFARAQQDLDYFTKTDRREKEESARRMVQRAERSLEYQSEELAQLLQMYEEDDLTEETEEIILKRQRNSVTDAEQMLERTETAKARILKTEIPREKEDLETGLQDSKLALATKRETLPRALKQKSLDVKKMIEEHQRADERLADLVQDRALMKLVAPHDGRVYYGGFQDGVWSVGQSEKFLKRGGALPRDTTLLTLVSEGTRLRFFGKVEESQVGSLMAGQKGYFAPKANPRKRLAAELVSVARYPDLAGKYAVEFTLEGVTMGLVPGMQGSVKVVTEFREQALTVPSSAVVEKSDGSLAVRVKSEGGEGNQERVISVGSEADGTVVVKGGLKAGEVVIVNAAEAKGS